MTTVLRRREKKKKKEFPEGKNKCLVFLFGRSENWPNLINKPILAFYDSQLSHSDIVYLIIA